MIRIIVIKGLEISKKFYESYGIDMLTNNFSELIPKIAIGLIGQGSECLGYDDDISKDHDFDPGFCIFIPDEFDDNIKFNLERAYSYLPKIFMGIKRDIMSPVGGNRHGIIRVSDFIYQRTGTKDGILSDKDFLYISEVSLLEITNGEIWRDDSGLLTSIRNRLAYFPYDIKLKKLSYELLNMAQSGQYNFKRLIFHEELSAARLAINQFVNSCIHATFLINEVYMPFYKWQFRALRDLSWPNVYIKNDKSLYVSSFEDELDFLLHLDDEQIVKDEVLTKIDNIAKIFIDRLRLDGLSEINELYLELHAYELNNKIIDNDIRNMPISNYNY